MSALLRMLSVWFLKLTYVLLSATTYVSFIMTYHNGINFSKKGLVFVICDRINTVCPTHYRTGWLVDRCSMSQQLGALQTHTTDTFLFISHTTNILLFKFRCNIFIGVRIIKEMLGSVGSGTPYIRNFEAHQRILY